MTSDPNPSAALDQLVDSFLDRQRRGERPTMEEYLCAHPHLAEQIREIFPALEVLEEFGPGQTTSALAGKTAGAASACLGEFRILREVGRGGMGIVYEAVQEPLGRHVALKVLTTAARDNAAALQRFRREAQSAARLHHSAIVPVFSVGEQDGVCYYAMQYIVGQTLAGVLQEIARLRDPAGTVGPQPGSIAHSLLTGRPGAAAETAPAGGLTSPPASTTDLQGAGVQRGPYFRNVARIGAVVAEALAYAHDQGVVHRDVKPANLMLDLHGGVWLTDFGLARLEGADELTQTGDILGTLRYAAPEQLQGHGEARSDVYSLGITLYEMATLQPAFSEPVKARLIDRILKEEPTPPGKLEPQLPRDLETIILKATAKEPAPRYPSAQEMAEDLRRFLGDRPVRARRARRLEHAWRWCRRNPGMALLAGSLALLIGVVIPVLQLVHSLGLQAQLKLVAEAEQEERSAKRAAREEQWRAMLSEARALSRTRGPGQRFGALGKLREALQIARAEGLTEADQLEFRNAAIACFALPDVQTIRTWPALEGEAADLAFPFSFDARLERYARTDPAGTVSVRRVADDTLLGQIPGAGREMPVFLSPDGIRLARVDLESQELTVWDVGGPQPRRLSGLEGRTSRPVVFSPDSKRLAWREMGQGVAILDLASGRTVVVDGSRLDREALIAFSPDSTRVAFTRLDAERNDLLIYDAATGHLRQQVPIPLPLRNAAWHPAGDRLALWGARQFLMVDAATGRQLSALAEHPEHGLMARFDRTGDLILTKDRAPRARLLDATLRPVLRFPSGSALVLDCSRDEDLLATQSGAKDGHLRLLRLARGTDVLRRLAPSEDRLFHTHTPPAYSPRDNILAIASILRGGPPQPLAGITLVDVRTGKELGWFDQCPQQPMAFDPDGGLQTAGPDGLYHWPRQVVDGGIRFGPPRRLDPFSHLPDGGSMLTSSARDVVAFPFNHSNLLILRDYWQVHRIPVELKAVHRHTPVSPDGRWAAAPTFRNARDGVNARVYDTRTGALVKDLRVEAGCEVGFSPGGRWLWASAGQARIWRAGTWEESPTTFSGVPLAFAPDDNLAAAGEPDGAVRLVDPETGAELARLSLPDQERLLPRTFTADGGRLVLVTDTGWTAMIWDLRQTRALLRELDLDWDRPPLPPELPPAPLSPIRIDLGGFSHNQQANRFEKQEQWPEAVAAWRKSLEADPNQSEVHRRLAGVLLKRPPRDLAAALSHAERAVALCPSRNTHFVRGEVKYALKDYRAAREDFSAALRIDPALADAYHWRAHCHELLGDPRSALADVSQSIQFRPENSHYHDMKADYHFRLKEYAQTLAMAERAAALAKQPGAETAAFLGLAHFRLGDHARAIAPLTRAAELREGGPSEIVLLALALSYHHTGQADKAQQSYEQALAWHKKHPKPGPYHAGLFEELRSEAEKRLGVRKKAP